MEYVLSVRTKLSRRRAVCARVGVLEDVRWGGRRQTNSALGDELLGTGLYAAEHHEDALSVYEAELAMKRRVGVSEETILAVQTNLASTYQMLGRFEEASSMYRDIYSGYLRLLGAEYEIHLILATNYADSLVALERFEEAKSLMRKTMPVARRVLGESNEITLRMKQTYAIALYKDPGATLDDLREAVATLEDTARIARRVLGPSHPTTENIVLDLQNARAALAARDVEPLREAVGAMQCKRTVTPQPRDEHDNAPTRAAPPRCRGCRRRACTPSCSRST